MYDDLLFINTVSDIRIKEMSNKNSNSSGPEVPHYSEPEGPYDDGE